MSACVRENERTCVRACVRACVRVCVEREGGRGGGGTEGQKQQGTACACNTKLHMHNII